MNWEVKLPLYLFLFYFFYGLFSWAEIGDFVPPIIIMPIIIPMVGLFYISKNIKSLYNVIYLLFSIGITVNIIPFLSSEIKNYIYIVTLFVLIVFSLILFIKCFLNKSDKKYLYFPLIILTTPILYLENDFYPLLYFSLLGLASFFSYKQKAYNSIGEQRFLLLTGFSSSIYLINFLPYLYEYFVFN